MTGSEDASKARTWTTSSSEPPRHGLQRRGEPDQRALAGGEAGALGRAQPLDQGDPGLGRGDVGLGRLDPGREGGGLGVGPGGFAGGALRLALDPLGALPGGLGLLLSLGERGRGLGDGEVACKEEEEGEDDPPPWKGGVRGG